MNIFIPVAPMHYNKQPTSDIWHHINCLRTLRRKLNKHPTNHNQVKYDNSSNLLQAKISSAKDNYESSQITSFADVSNSKIYICLVH